MKRLVIDPQAVERVNAAISKLEQRTSTEIVAVLTPKSADYLHVPYEGGLWGAALALGLMCVASLLRHGELPEGHIGWFLLVAAGGFVAGAFLARYDPVERRLAGEEVMLAEATQRARAVFHEHRLFRTTGGTGVLVFVSMFEHMVIILGDESVSAKVTVAEFQAIVDRMIDDLKRGEIEQAFHTGLGALEPILAERLPRAASDVNELPDRLYVV
jgi:putative membrane protein